MTVLRPDKILQNPVRITPQMLEKMNVTALLLDLDGTLTGTRERELSPEISAWLEDIQRAGIKIFLLSNNKSGARVRDFAEKMGVPHTHLARKPRRAGYIAAARELGVDIKNTAMVGDQIYTDTLGANRAGAKAILVEMAGKMRWYHKLRRLAELPFRKEKTHD